MLKRFFSSRKFVVFLTTVLVAAGVHLLDLPPETAGEWADKLMVLASVYIGGVAIEDAGRHMHLPSKEG